MFISDKKMLRMGFKAFRKMLKSRWGCTEFASYHPVEAYNEDDEDDEEETDEDEAMTDEDQEDD
jgi:hypothetical protein